jgi:hypothetical protein
MVDRRAIEYTLEMVSFGVLVVDEMGAVWRHKRVYLGALLDIPVRRQDKADPASDR